MIAKCYSLSMFLFLRVLMTSVIPKIYFALTGRMYFDAVYTQGGALGYWIYALTKTFLCNIHGAMFLFANLRKIFDTVIIVRYNFIKINLLSPFLFI